MTQKTAEKPSIRQMLAHTQSYRTTLESLYTIGKSLLSTPALEQHVSDAYTDLVGKVLTEADHQGDLAVVDGVDEAEARVELLMQDVLVPRVTEVEEIEKRLAEHEESKTPVPFTSRDVETASQEAMVRKEMLDLLADNIQLTRTIVGMESVSIDVARDSVLLVAKRMGAALESIQIDIASLEATQVLGEMVEAVDRIEALVEKAHEAAEEALSACEFDQGEDPMEDLIEKHREENPSGTHVDDDVTVGSLGDSSDDDEEESGDEGSDDDESGEDSDDEGSAGDEQDEEEESGASDGDDADENKDE